MQIPNYEDVKDVYSPNSHKRVLWLCPYCNSRKEKPAQEAKNSVRCSTCSREHQKTLIGEKSPKWKNRFPKCLNCSKQLKNPKSTRCRPCNDAYIYGENSPVWKGGMPKCLECGTPLGDRASTRCPDCYILFRIHEIRPRWRDKLPNCGNCGVRLGGKRSKLCQKCAGNEHNGNTKLKRIWGKKHQTWSNTIKARDNFTCRKCNVSKDPFEVKPTDPRICAHHIESWAMAPTLRFDLSNGATLCEDCHLEFHRLFGPFTTRTQLDFFLSIHVPFLAFP